MRFALKLQDRDLSIKFRPGRANGNADGLSRQGWTGVDESEPISDVVCQAQPEGLALAGGPVGLASDRKRRQRKKKS